MDVEHRVVGVDVDAVFGIPPEPVSAADGSDTPVMPETWGGVKARFGGGR